MNWFDIFLGVPSQCEVGSCVAPLRFGLFETYRDILKSR